MNDDKRGGENRGPSVEHDATESWPANSGAVDGTDRHGASDESTEVFTDARTDIPMGGESSRENAPLQPTRSAARYDVLESIAQGGMGEVLRVQDRELGRQLALKVIRADSLTKPIRRRFYEEARITGQLQHPGIPPVHEIGVMDDGRPFFAMKLVAGKTLDQLLKESSNSEDNLSEYLVVFEQVAQTLAYAHQAGVIHRDLKPLNVMVGAFGEVQVMDWGLAKRLDSGDESVTRTDAIRDAEPDTKIPGGGVGGDATVAFEEGGNVDFTQQGEVMGTLAYMPPEQATGDVAQIDQRVDVFALGALLCRLLTGAPPYTGPTAAELHGRAARGELEDAWRQLDESGADRELVQLTKDCLQVAPADRPADAGVVATRIRAYLAGLQRQRDEALAETRAAQVRASEEQKRRRLSMALASLIVVMILAASAVGFAYQRYRQAERLEEVDKRNLTVRLEAEILQSLASAEEIYEQLGSELTDYNSAMATIENLGEWQGRVATGLAILDRAKTAAESAPGDIDSESQDRLVALQSQLSSAARSLQRIQQLDEIRGQSAFQLSDDYQIDESSASDQYAQVFATLPGWSDGEATPEVVQSLRESLIRWHWTAALDHWADISDNQEQIEGLLAIARQVDPDPVRDELRSINTWSKEEQRIRAVEELRVAESHPALILAFMRRLETPEVLGELCREASLVHSNDFWVQLAVGGYGVDNSQKLSGLHAATALRPNSPVAWYNLGGTFVEADMVPEAQRCYEKAWSLAPTSAAIALNLALALRKNDSLESAHAVLSQALESNPQSHSLLFALATTLNLMGKPADALQAMERAIEIAPDRAEYYFFTSSLKNELKGPAAQLEYLDRGLKLDPSSAKGHGNRGEVLFRMGRVSEGVEALQRALELDADYVPALANLARVYQQSGDHRQAEALYRRATELDPDQAAVHLNFGIFLLAKRRADEAIPYLQRSIGSDPTNPNAWGALSNCLAMTGRFNQSREKLVKALELLEDDSPLKARAEGELKRLDTAIQQVAAIEDAIEDSSELSGQQLYRLGLFAMEMSRRYRSAAILLEAAGEKSPEFKASGKLSVMVAMVSLLAASGAGVDNDGLTPQARSDLAQAAIAGLEAHIQAVKRGAGMPSSAAQTQASQMIATVLDTPEFQKICATVAEDGDTRLPAEVHERLLEIKSQLEQLRQGLAAK